MRKQDLFYKPLQDRYIVFKERTEALSDTMACSQHVFEYIKPLFRDAISEEFWVIILNARNKIVDKYMVARGSMHQCGLTPREVFIPILLRSGFQAIISHNHPSGDITPSHEDVAFTDRLVNAGNILGIRIIDHIIVGAGSEAYTSLRDEGKIRCGQ